MRGILPVLASLLPEQVRRATITGLKSTRRSTVLERYLPNGWWFQGISFDYQSNVTVSWYEERHTNARAIVFVGYPHQGRKSNQEQRFDRLRFDRKDDHPDGRIPALWRSEPGFHNAEGMRHGAKEEGYHSQEGGYFGHLSSYLNRLLIWTARTFEIFCICIQINCIQLLYIKLSLNRMFHCQSGSSCK